MVFNQKVGLSVLGGAIFLSAYPYFVWGKSFLLVFCVLIALLVSAYFLLVTKNKFSLSSLLFSLTSSLIVFFYSNLNDASLGYSIYLFVIFFCMFSLSKESVFFVFDLFKKIFAMSLIPGIVIWVLHLLSFNVELFFLGKILIDNIPNQLKVEQGMGYYLFPGSVMLDYMMAWPVFRFQGMFDEPGVIGTIAALVLCSTRFELKNKYNLLIFFGGVISFSLAFYVLTLIYYIMQIRRNVSFIVLSLTVFLFAATIPSPLADFIDQRIVQRLLVNDDGELSGNNRYFSKDEKLFITWQEGDLKVFMFGLNEKLGGSSSWKNVFIKTGFIGFLIIVLIYASLCFRFRVGLSLHVLTMLVLFVASFYQRTAILTPVFLIVFMAGICGLKLIVISNK
ncbi:hypothetical protein [uncultured Kiloniella sp.]|uniref:hypothetical protein n=1 Tax=uncultured Kiloniella sp. TaxID=1133091 RepID=UPI002616934C|nr:hypothetical protein [uncultured Kiloniella sp.]